MKKYEDGTAVCETRCVTIAKHLSKKYLELRTRCQKCQTPITFLYNPTHKSTQAICSGCEFLNTFTFEVEG